MQQREWESEYKLVDKRFGQWQNRIHIPFNMDSEQIPSKLQRRGKGWTKGFIDDGDMQDVATIINVREEVGDFDDNKC